LAQTRKAASLDRRESDPNPATIGISTSGTSLIYNVFAESCRPGGIGGWRRGPQRSATLVHHRTRGRRSADRVGDHHGDEWWDYNAPAGFNANFAPQLGSTEKIQTKGAFIESLVFRNGALWASQTIFIPAGGAATRTAVQWWQLSPQGAILQRGLIDDSSGQNFYAYSSVSVNKFNDVLIGYSGFSSNCFASANYSFRAGNDPPNTMRGDRLLKAGQAPY
jgi:hypothetical protein